MITFQNVSFFYQDRPILEDLNLHLPAGSFHFLIGPSGAGKSTFLKLCSFDLMPNQGQIDILDQSTQQTTRDQVALARRRMGIMHQETAFIDHLSVFENVMLPVISAGLEPDQEKENVIELLNWVGLGERLSARPAELSGGEKQRAALARSVILAPDIILADEPTGNIDWEMGQRVLNLLIQLNTMGKTIVIATHDHNLIRTTKGKVQTRILKLDKGQIEIAGANL